MGFAKKQFTPSESSFQQEFDEMMLYFSEAQKVFFDVSSTEDEKEKAKNYLPKKFDNDKVGQIEKIDGVFYFFEQI